MIFIFVTAFGLKEDMDYLNNLRRLFEESGGSFYFVELEADLETRLYRNATPHRLESKYSKNDVERSKQDLLDTMKKYRVNSNEGEMICPNHLKINNTNLEPEEVARMVVEHFGLSDSKKLKK